MRFFFPSALGWVVADFTLVLTQVGCLAGAMFLEFQAPLATFMHPELAKVAGTDTVLRQGEVYENWVDVDVAVRK